MNSKSPVMLDEKNLVLETEKSYVYFDDESIICDKYYPVESWYNEKDYMKHKNVLYTEKVYYDGGLSSEYISYDGNTIQKWFHRNGNIKEEYVVKDEIGYDEWCPTDGKLEEDNIFTYINYQGRLNNGKSFKSNIEFYEDNDIIIRIDFYDSKSRIQKVIRSTIDNDEICNWNPIKCTYDDEHTGKIKQIEKKYERIFYEYDKFGNRISAKLVCTNAASDANVQKPRLRREFISTYENNLLVKHECIVPYNKDEWLWIATYKYDEKNNRKEVIYQNDNIVLVKKLYRYNEINKLEQLIYLKDNVVLIKKEYKYDKKGRIISQKVFMLPIESEFYESEYALRWLYDEDCDLTVSIMFD